MKMTQYREQHDILLELSSKISAQLDAKKLADDATEVRRLLSKLLGVFRVHLAMEDRALYPGLLQNSDDHIRTMAKDYMEEMGGISAAVETYKSQWPSASNVQKDPSEFVQQTEGIIRVLAQRIDKENNELYVVLEAQ